MRRSLGPRAGVLIGCALLLLMLGVSPWGLWERDEGRYADVAREMLARPDFITPRLNGAVFLDKPPLVYWVTAGSLWLWGHGETGARFGQLLFGLGALLVTRRIGILLFERRRANIALLILASSIGFFSACHLLTLDLGLAFFVSLTLWLFLRGFREGPEGQARRWYLGMFAGAALGVLTKGPIGALLPAMTIGMFLVLTRNGRRARELPWIGGGCLFQAIVLPWYVAVAMLHPDFLAYFFLHENVARFSTTVHRHTGSWYYYLVVGAASLMPWSPLAALRLLNHGRPLRAWFCGMRQEPFAFLWSWVLPGFLFFSAAQSKLPLYILPILPAAALGLAAILDGESARRPASRILELWPATWLLLAAGALAVLWRRQGAWEQLREAGIGLPLALMVAVLSAAALLTGSRLLRRGRQRAGVAATALLWMAASYALFAVVGRVNFFNETKHFASILQQEMRGGEPVFAYRCYLRGLPFYLGDTVGLVSPHSDDLKFGRRRNPDPKSFMDEESLVRQVAGDGRVFVVLRHGDLQDLQRRSRRPLYILARSDTHDLVSNRLGVRQEQALLAALDSTVFDLEDAMHRAGQTAPGGTVDMIEVENFRGQTTFSLRMLHAGSAIEVEFPMGQPGRMTVEKDDPAGEESGDEDHLLRLSPPPGAGGDIPRLVRGAAGK